MSSQWKAKSKIIVIVLVVMTMLVGVIPLTHSIVSEATTIQTTSGESYDITNGDFESGRVGYSVRGWELTAMGRGLKTGEDAGLDDETMGKYIAAYEFKTSETADGNRIAALTKKGSGYVAMASESFEVSGGNTYWISYDFFLQQMINKAAEKGKTISDTDFHGISLAIKEYDAEGNATWSKLSSDDSYGDGRIYTDNYTTDSATQIGTYTSTAWTTIAKEYHALPNTVRAELYIKVGAQAYVTGTILIDDVTVHLYDNYEIPNGDFKWLTADKDGGRTSGVGPSGWTSVSTNQNGKESDSNNYHNNFAATVTYEADGNAVMQYTYASQTSLGYAWILSPSVAIEAGEKVSASYRYKITGKMMQNAKSAIFFYDEDGNELSRVRTTGLGMGALDWTIKITDEAEAPENTAYAKVGFYVGRKRVQAANDDYPIYDGTKYYYDEFTLYFDDITLNTDAKVEEWVKETSTENGKPRTDSSDFTANYGMRKVNGGGGHKEVLQLYVAREEGMMGGVTFYSQPIAVTAGKEYTTSFDLKTQGYDGSSNVFGATYVLRYLDSEGNALNGNKPEVCNEVSKENMDWTHYSYTFTAPENATSVQVGLVIGTYTKNVCPNMTYSWDNMVLMEKEAHEIYVKDPAVTVSPLYEKTALFAGASGGSDIAVIAQSYSEMKVTDACSNQTAITEQLAANSGETYEYLFLNIGKEELEAGLEAGSVTAEGTFEFDTNTFAGVLEDLFANVTLYYDGVKVICLLTTNDAGYQTIAEAAAAKWNITLVAVGAYDDTVVKWHETIEPVETAETFDCYEVVGLGTYLTGLFQKLESSGVSVTTDMAVLERILVKAENCPDTDEDYQMLSSLAADVEQFIARFEDLRPEIKGATIAINDPNQLQFLANAPKKELTAGVTVKQMGILVIAQELLTPDAAGYMADAALEVGNSYATQLDTVYTKAGEAYGVALDVKDVDPSVSYTAVAYIIYEANAKEYIYYSNNDYENTLGEKTAENGRCTKSVYEIARTVALKLAVRKDTDFSAIGGEQNKNLIATATEVSEVSLYQVYQMLGRNAESLITWLNGGGVSQ